MRALDASFDLDNWQFSEELQLTGFALNDRLKFVLGGYYFKERSYFTDFVNFNAGLLQAFGPNYLKTENYAFFGQVDFELSSLIAITLGGRYTSESKDFNGGQSDLNGFNYKLFNCPVYSDPCTTALGYPDPSQPLRFYVPETQHRKFNNFSPKVGIQLHPSDDVMLYGSWSRGYKTGGWTTRLTNGLPYAPSFDPEVAETFEIGLKSEFLNRRLQFNAAAFTTKYSGIQLNFQQGLSPTTQNAGNARIKGFEAEVVAAPVYGLTINTSLGYTDAYYTNVDGPAQVASSALQAGVFVGASLPKTPKWKFNISPRYQYSLASGGKLIALADFTLISKIWNNTERDYTLLRESSNLLNLSATYEAPGAQWSLTIGGTNVTDDRYLISGGNQAAAGVLFGTYNRPAEWYAQLGVRF